MEQAVETDLTLILERIDTEIAQAFWARAEADGNNEFLHSGAGTKLPQLGSLPWSLQFRDLFDGSFNPFDKNRHGDSCLAYTYYQVGEPPVSPLARDLANHLTECIVRVTVAREALQGWIPFEKMNPDLRDWLDSEVIYPGGGVAPDNQLRQNLLGMFRDLEYLAHPQVPVLGADGRAHPPPSPSGPGAPGRSVGDWDQRILRASSRLLEIALKREFSTKHRIENFERKPDAADFSISLARWGEARFNILAVQTREVSRALPLVDRGTHNLIWRSMGVYAAAAVSDELVTRYKIAIRHVVELIQAITSIGLEALRLPHVADSGVYRHALVVAWGALRLPDLDLVVDWERAHRKSAH